MNELPRCCAMVSVPYTNRETGEVYWKTEPCQYIAEDGSKLCMFHQQQARTRAELERKADEQIETAIKKLREAP